MSRVARERQAQLQALQLRHAETESRCRVLTRQVESAGLSDAGAEERERAADIDQSLFGAGGSVKTPHRPPDGWPPEVEYSNQLLWDEVPPERHFLRDRIADPTSVKRPHRLRVVLIKNKKHPCCGERGLYAAEEIPAGMPLLDYAGRVSVVVGDDHDTNKSSYLLNLFRDDEAGVFIDIDAARCGNEGRFVNDYHGTGMPPNAQFWPYYDPVTGEKRMAVKSISPLATGDEILVDYGGSYFQKDSSDDSDMHDSDEEFDGRQKGKSGGKRRGPPQPKKAAGPKGKKQRK